MTPTPEPRTDSTALVASRLVLVALPFAVVVAAFVLSRDAGTKRLVAALGWGCFAASFSFYLAFCLRVTADQSATKGGSFAKNFAKNAAIFALSLAAFALALFLPTDSASVVPQGDNPSLSEGMDAIGCATLAKFFGPILLGFLLRETTQSMI